MLEQILRHKYFFHIATALVILTVTILFIIYN